jgi:hypothetical protein
MPQPDLLSSLSFSGQEEAGTSSICRIGIIGEFKLKHFKTLLFVFVIPVMLHKQSKEALSLYFKI